MANSFVRSRLFLRRLLLASESLKSAECSAFTLVEFVLVVAVSVAVLWAAAIISVNEARSNIRAYVYQSLRDRIARITFLIEGEVAEASDLVTVEPSKCRESVSGKVFLFGFTHKYTSAQSSPDDAIICYYNGSGSDQSLYRFGPKFDDQTGVLSTNTNANASSLALIGRKTQLSDIEYDQGLLKYAIKIGVDSTQNGSVWDASYSPDSKQTARIGTACMPSSTPPTGCW